MAKKKEETYNDKKVKAFIGDFTFKKPEKMEDGTLKTERYRTGIIMLDTLLNGGFPIGRTIAFGAEPGIGKTTILIQACGNIIEKYDKKVYYLDVEGGASYELIDSMGYSHLIYDKEDNPEGKFFLLNIMTIQEIATLLKQITLDEETAVIVIDSDTQVTDGLMLEKDDLGTSDKSMGSNARMWSKAAKPISAVIKKSNACLILVHQARIDLSGFYPRVVATGGNAAKHMSSAEIWGKRKSWIKEDRSFTKKSDEAVGAYLTLNTKKNRLTKPFSSVKIPVFFGLGVDNAWAYKDWIEEYEIENTETGEVHPVLEKSSRGGYYTLHLPSGEYKCQGEANVWDLLDEHFDEVRDFIKSHGGFQVGKADDPYMKD